jgi:hypothetical protein
MDSITKRLLSRVLASILLISITAAANATQATGRISELWVNDGATSNVVWLRLGTAFSSPCGTGGYMVLDLSDESMKSAYALALAAYMSDRNVTIGGNGACFNTYEKLKYIFIAQ